MWRSRFERRKKGFLFTLKKNDYYPALGIGDLITYTVMRSVSIILHIEFTAVDILVYLGLTQLFPGFLMISPEEANLTQN